MRLTSAKYIKILSNVSVGNLVYSQYTVGYKHKSIGHKVFL